MSFVQNVSHKLSRTDGCVSNPEEVGSPSRDSHTSECRQPDSGVLFEEGRLTLSSPQRGSPGHFEIASEEESISDPIIYSGSKKCPSGLTF